MLRSCITSVTFREKTIPEIATLTAYAGLNAIEWGADVHVPPGDLHEADAARLETKANGLEIAAYGSYYRAAPDDSISAVLSCAERLHCPLVRIWAGNEPSTGLSPDTRKQTTKRISDLVAAAQPQGITIATEYHRNTLTDSLASAMELLNDVPDLLTFWQPSVQNSVKQNVHALKTLNSRVANIHVYHRDRQNVQLSLCCGIPEWTQYFSEARYFSGTHYAAIEFVRNGTETQFLQDAAVLLELLDAANQHPIINPTDVCKEPDAGQSRKSIIFT